MTEDRRKTPVVHCFPENKVTIADAHPKGGQLVSNGSILHIESDPWEVPKGD